MNREEQIKHNTKVFNSAIQVLFDYRMVNTLMFVSSPQYGQQHLMEYLQAANIARTQMMDMEPIKLYPPEEED